MVLGFVPGLDHHVLRCGGVVGLLIIAVDRMATIAVYRFSGWDPDTGKSMVSSNFATLRAIKLCNGRNIEDSRLLVDTSELDRNEFYQSPTMHRGFDPLVSGRC